MYFDYLFLLINLIMGMFGQLLLKKNIDRIDYKSGLFKYFMSFFHKKLSFPFLLILLSPIFYLLALSDLPLGVAYVFTSLNYPLIIIGAYFYLGEKISFSQFFGGFLIFMGLIIYNLI